MPALIREQTNKPEPWRCSIECRAAANPGNHSEVGLDDGGPIVGIGLLRGLLAECVMTAFFGVLVLIGFVYGNASCPQASLLVW